MNSMEDLVSQANEKGMYLVDHTNTTALIQEYYEKIKEADALCEVIDPETHPYDSKYKARELLDGVCNKLEATKTVATMERNEAVMKDISRRIAAVRVRLGIIAWDTDEPHNTQIELEGACEYFFPEFVEMVSGLVASHLGENGNPETVSHDKMNLPDVPMPVIPVDQLVDAMKTLNMLGILWAGRSHVYKSFLYLKAANAMYEYNLGEHQPKDRIVDTKIAEEVGSVFTHNLFYLAQAYGNIGDTVNSSKFCHLTLQRQLSAGLDTLEGAMEWTKNCAGISDFYFSLRQFNHSYLALTSAEKILKENIIAKLQGKSLPVAGEDGSHDVPVDPQYESAQELEADLHRRWALLYSTVLSTAYEEETERRNAAALGEGEEPSEVDGVDVEGDHEGDAQLVAGPIFSPGDFNPYEVAATAANDGTESVFRFAPAPKTAEANESDNVEMSIEALSAAAQAVAASQPDNVFRLTVSFFKGLPITFTPLFTGKRIKTFEAARALFLRATTRLEAAKKHFVLDGFVTDHAKLQKMHSQLYLHLSIFEHDPKRKLAMHTRRQEMLAPLLAALSVSSFDVLHKEISYELGECAMGMLEIKLEKLRSKFGDGVINERSLKKAEVTNCNEITKTAMIMFAHFTDMYRPHARGEGGGASSQSIQNTYNIMTPLSLWELTDMGCLTPDEDQISTDELRPFLNSHFFFCRLLSKIIATPAYLPPDAASSPAGRAHYMVALLRRYEWLSKEAPRLVDNHRQRKQAADIIAMGESGTAPPSGGLGEDTSITVENVFGDELKICQEMSRLLPSKIDRMIRMGEGGLSL